MHFGLYSVFFRNATIHDKLSGKSLLNHIFDYAPESKPLSALIDKKPQNGYSGKPVKYVTKNLVLSLSATTSGTFKEYHFKYLDEDGLEGRNIWCQPGDILIQRGNTIEYVGVSAIYNGQSNKYIFPDLMIRVRANECLVETKYLYYALSSEKIRNYLRSRAIGSAGTMPKINQSTLLSTEIPLFSKTQQRQIVAEIESRFSLSDILMQSIDDAKVQAETLRQSILKKAFSGKLVPQDPNDEPASLLLERIRTEKHAQQSNGRKPRKKRKTA